ncbi:MAG: hypothetical protein ACRC2M_17620 [Planktothrix sp.]
MAEINPKSSTLPPKKRRDPALMARSQDEKQKKHEEYIGEIVESSVRESLREETMPPKPVQLLQQGKLKLSKLQEKLRSDEKNLLNIAFAYGYDEIQQNQLSLQELREKLESVAKDNELISFEILESNLDLVFKSRIADAYFIYINTGIELLYYRLVDQKKLPSLFTNN